MRIPLGKGFAGRVAAERRPVAIFDIDQYEVVNPILREKGIRSLLGVPLLVEGRVLGVLHVGTLTPRRFDAARRRTCSGSRPTAPHWRSSTRSSTSTAAWPRCCSAACCPHSLPTVPGLELAARYMPAASAASLGGDWYDVFRAAGRVGRRGHRRRRRPRPAGRCADGTAAHRAARLRVRRASARRRRHPPEPPHRPSQRGDDDHALLRRPGAGGAHGDRRERRAPARRC